MQNGSDSGLTPQGSAPVSALLMIDTAHRVSACNAGFAALHGGGIAADRVVGLPYHAILVMFSKAIGIADDVTPAKNGSWANEIYQRYIQRETDPALSRLSDSRVLEIEHVRLGQDVAAVWRDVSKQVHVVASLNDAFISAKEGLSLWDASGQLLRANGAFEQLLGELGLGTIHGSVFSEFLEQLSASLPFTNAAREVLSNYKPTGETKLLGLEDGRVLIAVRQPLSAGGSCFSLRWA
ncbi:MAG: PAS domain-containing protein, partial [Pseudomonadota bacterium]